MRCCSISARVALINKLYKRLFWPTFVGRKNGPTDSTLYWKHFKYFCLLSPWSVYIHLTTAAWSIKMNHLHSVQLPNHGRIIAAKQKSERLFCQCSLGHYHYYFLHGCNNEAGTYFQTIPKTAPICDVQSPLNSKIMFHNIFKEHPWRNLPF